MGLKETNLIYFHESFPQYPLSKGFTFGTLSVFSQISPLLNRNHQPIEIRPPMFQHILNRKQQDCYEQSFRTKYPPEISEV